MLIFLLCLGSYLFLLNFLGALLAGIDKRRAKKHKWRIAESTLLWVGALGGALGEFLMMRWIRHKTTRKKFMIGLPLLMLLHALLIAGSIVLIALYF